MALRHTIQRDAIVAVVNRMIAHLAESGTKADSDKREAIIALTVSILSENGGYAGYRHLNVPPGGAETLTYQDGCYYLPNGNIWIWDETRVAFY